MTDYFQIDEFHSNFFRSKNVIIPDCILSPDIFEPELRKNYGLNIPDVFNISKSVKPGCYAWIDFGVLNGLISVLYIGRALHLWNRLVNHYNLPANDFMSKWYDSLFGDESSGSGVIDCCVWFSEDRHKLELDLIKNLQPIYNVQRGVI